MKSKLQTYKHFLHSLQLFSLLTLLLHANHAAHAQFAHPVKNIRITSVFGESRADHFHSGIDYAGAQPVLAVSDGKVLFESDASENPQALPMGYGNLLVLGHKNNLRSHYLHLEDGSISRLLKNRTKIARGEAIAYMGESGYSIGKHLHLDIVNAADQKVYDPLIFLPKLTDNTAPSIVAFLLKVNNKIFTIRKRSVFRFFPESELYAIAWDKFSTKSGALRSKKGGHGIKVLETWQDDRLIKRLDFSEMKTIGDTRVLKSGENFFETYGLPFNFRIGFFSPTSTRHNFKIIAVDFNNNTSTVNYEMLFR